MEGIQGSAGFSGIRMNTLEPGSLTAALFTVSTPGEFHQDQTRRD
jgi:hypothetical protein